MADLELDPKKLADDAYALIDSARHWGDGHQSAYESLIKDFTALTDEIKRLRRAQRCAICAHPRSSHVTPLTGFCNDLIGGSSGPVQCHCRRFDDG